MAGNLQPLVSNQPIVKSDGTPTEYFIRWAQQKQIDIGGSITAAQAQALIDAWAAARQIIAGTGLAGGGPLSANVTLTLQAALENLTNVLVSGIADGQVLTWNAAAGKWENATPSGGVPSTRQILTAAPITGGGDLSADRTIGHAASGVAAGSYGDATHTVQLTIDADGHITAASNVAISFPAVPYRLSVFFTSALASSEVLFLHTFTSAVTYPINFAGSQGHCGTAPASATTLTVAKNGTNIGTINIATSGAVTFTLASATTFAIGDTLSITGPATVSTAANVSISLLG